MFLLIKRIVSVFKQGLDGMCREYKSSCLMECDPQSESNLPVEQGCCPLRGYPQLINQCDDISKSKFAQNVSNLKDIILSFVNKFLVQETEFPDDTLDMKFDYS